MLDLSIIIPARNEEKRLLPTLEAYYSYYTGTGQKFEIIIVCNDCSDNTVTVASNFSLTHKNTRVVYYPEKIGKGGAIKEGMKISNGKTILFVDADNSTVPRESYKLVRSVN